MRPESGFRMNADWQKRHLRHNLSTLRHRHFFNVALFISSNLVIGPSCMSIS